MSLERSIRRARFDLSKGFVARKDFTVQGQPVKAGDAFHWRRMAVSMRLLRQLWAQSYVDCAGASDAPVATPSVPAHVPAVGTSPMRAPVQLDEDDLISSAPVSRQPTNRKK